MLKLNSSIVVLPIIFAGCMSLSLTPPDQTGAKAAIKWEPLIQIEQKVLNGTEGKCEFEPCARIVLDFPEILAAPSEIAKKAIDDAVRSFLIQAVTSSDQVSHNLSEEEFIKNSLLQLRSTLANIPENDSLPPQWHLERRVTVLHQSPKIISLELEQNSYLGGAHGSTSHSFLNISLTDGRTLSFPDLVLPEFRAAFTKIAEDHFRKEKNIPAGTSLKEAGYTFNNNAFTLTDNVGITKDGLVFYFNEYEIAPYVMGPTRLVVPFNIVNAYLSPELSPDATLANSLPS